ncbi:MAG: hypothetical protein KF718_13285 [Polyangiaceae bacterium]|nr:hypothetical protein [Polyangiaceae bacterium]
MTRPHPKFAVWLLACLLWAMAVPVPAQDSPKPFTQQQLDELLAPIALYPDARERRLHLELGLAYGRVGAIEGFALDVGYSRIDRSLSGAQLAAGLARARDPKGVQIAPVTLGEGQGSGLNLAPLAINDSLTGMQLGAVTFARRLDGVQLGAVNVAGRVTGVQLGVVNVAEHVDGAPIGLVSVAKNTRASVLGFASYRFPANVGVKLVTGSVFNELSFGMSPDHALGDRRVVLGRGELVLGAHLPAGRWSFEPGLGYAFEAPLEESSTRERHQVASLRATLGLGLSDSFGLWVGAAARVRVEVEGGATDEQADALGGIQWTP